jgi:hypothetical protein
VGEEMEEASDFRRSDNKPKQNECGPCVIMKERASVRNYGRREGKNELPGAGGMRCPGKPGAQQSQPVDFVPRWESF